MGFFLNLLTDLLDLVSGPGPQANPLGLGGPPAEVPPLPATFRIEKGFDQAIAFTLRWEGGKVDDAFDRGGRTNMGITQRTYDAFNAEKGAYGEDVFDMSQAEAEAIYRSRFWNPDCVAMAWPFSLVHFDTCVLFGIGGARVMAAKTRDPLTYINLRRDAHRRVAEARPDQGRYLRGWLRRCDDLQKEAGL